MVHWDIEGIDLSVTKVTRVQSTQASHSFSEGDHGFARASPW
jgi:hypothetical protein